MSKFTNRADLLIAAGESIKMQEKAGIEPILKCDGHKTRFYTCGLDSKDYGCYEFPLAVVEDKPVFVGDELYEETGKKFTVNNALTKGCFGENWIKAVSWNPPKPKTVMVELLRDDAEYFSIGCSAEFRTYNLANACRKALEK